MFHFDLLPRVQFDRIAATCMARFRFSPATLATTAYLLAFAVVVSLLITPARSPAQFRGLPANMRNIPPTVPFNPILPTISSNFTGIATPNLMLPTFAPIANFTMPGPMARFPLSNFGTDTTGAFGMPFFGTFGGFTGFNLNTFSSPFGLASMGTFGFGNGMSVLGGGFSGFGMTPGLGLGGFGLTGFGGFGGFGGFNRVGFAFSGGMGGFAGKGFGGFNGKKGL